MGKVISIKQGRWLDTVAVANGVADPLLLDDSFILQTSEGEEIIDADLCKRIAYDLMQEETFAPLVKPMWPLSF